MRIGPQRPVNAEAIVAPQGYRVEALVTGLTFPSAISFGPGGEIYLAERGCPPGGAVRGLIGVPRVLRVDPDQSITEIGRLENPISGLVYRAGELFIGEDGPAPRILRVTAEGEVQVLVQGLPGGGDYGLSGLSLDSAGSLLFGLGTRTNSGVVGWDNVARGWVAAHPEWADVAGEEVELAGVNYVTSRPGSEGARLITGSFKPFGRRCEPQEKLPGTARCGGAVYRLPADAAEPERLAWGLRNPLGVACSPEGRVFVTEGGMEERGSRPVAGAPDSLWEIAPGGYYGWPDHAAGIPVNDARFRLPGHLPPRLLFQRAPKVAGTPAVTFAPRSGVGGVDFSTEDAFGFVGEALVALAGPWSAAAYPGEGNGAIGCRVVRVDPRTGQAVDFLVNRSGAPSSSGNGGGLERPFEVRFDPTGEVLYVVDMGEVHANRENGLEAYGGTGVVWRITRIRTSVQVPGGREARQDRRGRRQDAEEPTDRSAAEETDEAAEVTRADEGPEEAPAADLGTADAAGDLGAVEVAAEDAGDEAAEAAEAGATEQEQPSELVADAAPADPGDGGGTEAATEAPVEEGPAPGEEIGGSEPTAVEPGAEAVDSEAPAEDAGSTEEAVPDEDGVSGEGAAPPEDTGPEDSAVPDTELADGAGATGDAPDASAEDEDDGPRAPSEPEQS